MKVSELIEKLKELPQELAVCAYGDESEPYDIEDATLDKLYYYSKEDIVLLK